MKSNNLILKSIEEICPIRKGIQDDMFITCASFEERFLGSVTKLKGDLARKFIVFKYLEPNDSREKNIALMERELSLRRSKATDYHQIEVEHGKSVESVIKFHTLFGGDFGRAYVTVDITTFTKDLLINLLYYLIRILRVQKLRLLYTVPSRYASPEEGWLSSGIKEIHIPPMVWNGWSPVKKNLLIVIVGFEEDRAWSLIDRFSADLNWIFITKPGSSAEWDDYCERFNKHLLVERKSIGAIPALGAEETYINLRDSLTEEYFDKYNVFICPLGTKVQIIGLVRFCLSTARNPVNIITTTVISHNIPYYSWGVGSTYEFLFPESNLQVGPAR